MIFQRPRLIELADQPVKMAEEIERLFNRLNLAAVSAATTPETGNIAVVGEGSVARLGAWACVRNGVAYAATASRGDRFATGVVTALLGGSRVRIEIGNVSAAVQTFTTTDPNLYLSTAPGYAQDFEPAIGSGAWSQQVGFKTSGIIGAGRSLVEAIPSGVRTQL